MSHINNIKKILSEWDPIEVGPTISYSEYKDYAYSLSKLENDKDKLLKYLISLLALTMELPYDPKNNDHVADVEAIADKIVHSYNKFHKS